MAIESFEAKDYIEGSQTPEEEPEYWRLLKGQQVSLRRIQDGNQLYRLAVDDLLSRGIARIFPDFETIQLFDPTIEWEKADPFTAEELRDLLQREDFRVNAVEALRKTNTSGHKFMGKLMGQEFGFIVYRDPFQEERQPHISPLFEGTEGSIDLESHSIPYLLRNPGVPKRPVLNFHVHTHLWPTMERDYLGGTFLPGEDAFFSDRDLGYLYQNTRNNTALIMALGSEQNGAAQIIFISYGSQQSYLGFDYAHTYKQSKLYLEAGQDPLDAYRESGLNVAVLKTHLTDKPTFDSNEIKTASELLSRRV